MKKHTNQRILNRYPLWKYVVLVVTVIVMMLSAIPTWYGEDAAVQISSPASDLPDVVTMQNALQSAGIDVKRIDQSAQNTLVILQEEAKQTKARSVIADLVGESISDEQIALSLSPAAPQWLTQMGFEPIKLGLDLRGGVQFLLDVDVEQVYKAQGEQLQEALRQHFREEGVRSVRYSSDQVDKVILRLPNAAANSIARQYIRTAYPQWQATNGSGHGLVLTLKQDEKATLRNLTVQQNLQTMRSRIEELGITEALVQRQGEHRIRIELPGVQDPAAAKKVIGATASLAFYPVKDAGTGSTMTLPDEHGAMVRVARKPILGGDHIVDARASFGEMGAAEVNINLDSAGGRIMSEFSRHNIGKPMATAYSEYSRDEQGNAVQNSKIISVATIQSQLGNRFRITGAGSIQDAQQLALLLRAGSLTAPVTIVEERTIGPTLGAENIQNGFAALALGMGMTLVFMALWYRRLGWVANLALITNMVMLFGLLALIPGAVLTLPGIAGLVLTVGMAVDTNVLIFERIKDKLKEGRSLAQAIDRGFNSAFSTIFDANFTTMITAVVLYAIGNGPIQGFAMTLGLGLLTSMFTGIFASRAIINLVWGRDARREVRI
ncbi:protein translocase subunit SecD [Photobacterium sanctipauli]|uniref:Protein translocase subunit SecD n=1 Tax=Photobacterium sanctipauli TaxID=1342794 RepID=A0A2T3NWP5_9GAMM|nr:protein translocase subunit SecD [Photobacterium sanctipauli]PSW20685.1 protein translocase subunit SecD [Photobacterium sanctipauli]